MDCPFLKYVDGGFGSWEWYCRCIDRKVGDQNDKVKVENTCKNSHFYDCPYYKKKRG